MYSFSLSLSALPIIIPSLVILFVRFDRYSWRNFAFVIGTNYVCITHVNPISLWICFASFVCVCSPPLRFVFICSVGHSFIYSFFLSFILSFILSFFLSFFLYLTFSFFTFHIFVLSFCLFVWLSFAFLPCFRFPSAAAAAAVQSSGHGRWRHYGPPLAVGVQHPHLKPLQAGSDALLRIGSRKQ